MFTCKSSSLALNTLCTVYVYIIFHMSYTSLLRTIKSSICTFNNLSFFPYHIFSWFLWIKLLFQPLSSFCLSLSLPGWCLQVSVGVWLTHRLNNSLGPNEISLALMKPLMRLHGFRPLPHTQTDSLTLPHTLNLTSKHAFVLSGTEQACKSTRLHEWTVQTLALHGSNVILKQAQKKW